MPKTSPDIRPRHHRVPALDLLRPLAAIGVVLFHYAYRDAAANEFTTVSLPSLAFAAKYGWFGVQLFFVISGFVIAWSAVGRTSIEFGIARVGRLWPAFVACVTIICIATYLFGAPRFETSFLQPFMDGAYGSIVVEITFYGWMALFIALGQFPKRVDDLVLGWLGIALVNEALLHSAVLRHLFMTEYAGFFCAGILLAEIARGRRGWQAPFLIVVSTVIACSEALVGGRETAAHYSTFIDPRLMIGLTILAIALVALASRIRSLPLPDRLLLALGGLTYPLYLLYRHIGSIAFNRLHDFVPAEVLIPVTAIVIIAVSLAVWQFIEPPGRKLVANCAKAVVGYVTPFVARFAGWYARKASSWISGMPARTK